MKIFKPIFLSSFFLISCKQRDCNELFFDKLNKITYYNNSIYTGSCKSYFYTGELRSEEEYLDGKDHGYWKFYFKDGSIQTKGEFDLGKRVGKWEYFFEKDKIWKIVNYNSNGEKSGRSIEYKRSGEIIFDQNF